MPPIKPYKPGEYANWDFVNDHIPHAHMNLEDLNNMWRQTEKIYYGYMPKQEMTLPSDDEFVQKITNFWKYKLWQVTPDETGNHFGRYTREYKAFVRIVWLAKEYLTNCGFDTLYSVHYNPRKEINVIHPGGGRAFITKVYDQNENVEVFYFNTGGVQPNWLEGMKPIELYQLKQLGYSASFVADHGSMIPHVFYRKNDAPLTTHVAVNKFKDNIVHRANTIKISSNAKLPKFFIPQTNKKDFDYHIDFKKKYNDYLFCKAIVLAIADVEYNGPDLKVKRKRL